MCEIKYEDNEETQEHMYICTNYKTYSVNTLDETSDIFLKQRNFIKLKEIVKKYQTRLKEREKVIKESEKDKTNET